MLLALSGTSTLLKKSFAQVSDSFYVVDTTDYYKLSGLAQGFLDSLLNEYHQSSEDTFKIGVLLQIQRSLSRSPISISYGSLALGTINKMLLEAKTEQNEVFLRYKAHVFQGLAWSHNSRGDLVTEIEMLLQMLQVNEVLKDSVIWSSNLASLGTVYGYQKEFARCEKYLREGLVIAEEAGLEQQTAELYMRLGYMFLSNKNFDEAIESLERCLSFEETNEMSPILMAQVYDNLGAVYLRLKDFEQASYTLHRAAEFYEEVGGPLSKGLSLIGLASLELELGNLDLAEEYGLEAHAVVLTLDNPGNMKSLLGILSRIYEAKGEYKMAFDYHKQAERMNDSLANVQSVKLAIEKDMQRKHEKEMALDSIANAEAMKVQNALLRAEQAESRRTKNQRVFLVLGLVISIAFGSVLFNRFKAVTKQKELVEKAKEELVLAHQKLEELDATKSRFFTNISHELRTPLTVIRGVVTELREHPDKNLEYGTEMISRNTESLLQLVNQMLDLRKLESGELKIDLTQSDIVPYVAYIFSSLESLANTKGLEMSFESSVDQLVMDYDEAKVKMIVSNLLSNAIKYTPSGGTVSGYIEQNVESGQLVLKVSDTGIGIPEHAISKVFDRFYQVDEKERKAIEGTGIGLTLSKELVEFLGGTIEVESKEHQGSTFIVRLPIENRGEAQNFSVKNNVVALEGQMPEFVSKSDVKLLIVEDNADVSAYLKIILERSYELSFAGNGQIGYEMATQEVPDLVLSDVMMPHKDGFELCNDLRKHELTSHIPVILLTARADVESRISGLERGADAYLAKPIDKRELEAVLSNLLIARKRIQEHYSKVTMLPAGGTDTLPQEDAFLQRIWTAVENNLEDNEFKVPQLCQNVGVSRSQLHQKVKALTGKSITHYVRAIRVAKAKQMLEQGQMNVSEISYAVGFSDPTYFSKVFHGETGKSPSEFRQ